MDATHFVPNASTTRAMMVTTLYRLAGSPEVTEKSSFTDVPENTWYTDAVAWAVQNGVTEGTSEETFSPHENVTREQAATFLYRYATNVLGFWFTLEGDLSGYTAVSYTHPDVYKRQKVWYTIIVKSCHRAAGNLE